MAQRLQLVSAYSLEDQPMGTSVPYMPQARCAHSSGPWMQLRAVFASRPENNPSLNICAYLHLSSCCLSNSALLTGSLVLASLLSAADHISSPTPESPLSTGTQVGVEPCRQLQPWVSSETRRRLWESMFQQSKKGKSIQPRTSRRRFFRATPELLPPSLKSQAPHPW
jgi:hypothetical protein